MATRESYRPVAASFLAASGSSNAARTWTTSTSWLAAPARSSASTAADSSRSVMKLLKRLTTIPNRNPTALSSPSIDPGCNFVVIQIFCTRQKRRRRAFYPLLPLPHPLSLLPFELGLPFFKKRLRSFPHVFRRAREAKERRLKKEALFLRHFDAALDRFDGVLHGQRRVGDYFLGHALRSSQQFARFVNVIHQPDALRLFGGDHLSRQTKFVRHALAAKPRKPLRPAISRNDTQLHLGLAELRSFARNPNRARKRQ